MMKEVEPRARSNFLDGALYHVGTYKLSTLVQVYKESVVNTDGFDMVSNNSVGDELPFGQCHQCNC